MLNERTIRVTKTGIEVLPREIIPLERAIRTHLQPAILVVALVLSGVLGVKAALTIATGSPLAGVLGVAMLAAIPAVLVVAHVTVRALTLGPVAKPSKKPNRR